MFNILVTGAKGQLGRKISDNSSIVSDSEFIYVDIDDLDLTDIQQIDELFKIHQFDFVINCAAYTAVDAAEEDKQTAKFVNADAPAYLAKKCSDCGAKFIHVSTDYVFDGQSNVPYSEITPTCPVSVYGQTKLDGENLVVEENSDSIITRTSWLYSEYGKNFALTILRFAKERDSLNVVYDQIGTPTYAGDLADAILEIVDKHQTTNKWVAGIYHFSNLGVCSWYDFAIYLVKSQGISTKVNPVFSSDFKTKAKRPAYSVLSKSKITNNYNLSIPYWTDACNKMLRKLK